MRIDRERVLEAFEEYTSHYDLQQEMIRLKAEHTYRVAGLCERIAQAQGLSQAETDIAWLTGMLHDVGRFEQQRVYGTFNDAMSIDHAQYGADILFREGKIRDYLTEAAEDELIEAVVRYHSAYRIPEALSEKTALFCNILRDADKIDIFKVNIEFPLEEIYNVSREELYSCAVTEEVMQCFEEGHAVLRALKRTAVDHVAGHLSLVYELVFPISLQIAAEQGYVQQLMNFPSENALTREQFAHIRERLEKLLHSAY